MTPENSQKKKEPTLEILIDRAIPDLRELTFHSDGRVIARTGGKAKHPKRLYAAKLSQHSSWSATTKTAITKLLKEK